MKISLNWLKDYIDIPCDETSLSDILTNLGLEVEGVQKIESITGGLKGIVVGQVLTCIKHPNADRLSLTEVSVGDGQTLQIVCGAPNVATGQKVPVATVGTTLFPINGDSFVIKKGKIRGETSEGMICAEDEMGIGEDHSGIMVLPEHLAPGTPLSDHIPVETDVVYDIGLTPNRSDATSHLGVARDLAAYFTFHEQKPWPVKWPENEIKPAGKKIPTVKVRILDQIGCPRYSGLSLADVEIGSSPQWMQNRLKAVDVRPINNIVDITNYVLHEYGQPLHAFDQERIEGREIVVQNLTDGSVFTSLDTVERTLSADDLMICDANHSGMCIAGIYGGLNSGVTEKTKTIFLESAHFNPTRIRKSSTNHGLRTDAAKCFEKGTDPNMTVHALRRAASLMQTYGGAKIGSDIVDVYPDEIVPAKVRLRHHKINNLIGNDIKSEEVESILTSLSIGFQKENDDYLVQIPTNKIDVTREADVIEEILRVYGFNNIDVDDRITTSVIIPEKIDRYRFRQLLSAFLAGKGYSEMMGLSLIPSKLFEGKLAHLEKELVLINNTSNVHLDAMRPEMMMSALFSVAYNHNRQQQNLRLFEFGTAYRQVQGDISETQFLTLMLSGEEEAESWLGEKGSVDFYSIKRTVREVLDRLGIGRFQSSSLEDARFEYGVRDHLGNRDLVRFGLISDVMMERQDIRSPTFYAEFFLDNLLDVYSGLDVVVEDIPKFPSVRRDLSMTLDKDVDYADLERIVKKVGGRILQNVNLFDVYVDDELKGLQKKSYAIGMTFVDPLKNLRDEEVDRLVKKIVSECGRQLKAELR